MKVVHFGAGNIGKGLIGLLLKEAGFTVTLVDVDYGNTQKIHNDRSYLVMILGENNPRTIPADGICSIKEKIRLLDAIEKADLITTSVGANNLTKIAPTILKALLNRFNKNKALVDIIANENMINATNHLKSEIFKISTDKEQKLIASFVGFANSAIDRLALSTNYNGSPIPLVEPYAEWIINKSELKSEISKKISGATYVDDMTYYIERKLYCVNANHAALAYLGFTKGQTYIHQVFKFNEAIEIVNNMHKEIALYFSSVYKVDLAKHYSYIEKTMQRHSNDKIDDKISRVGRNPIRKLGPEERLLAPFNKLSAINSKRDNLAKVIASTLLFNVSEDEESVILQEKIKTNGLNKTITEICSITKAEDINLISQEYLNIKSRYS